MSKWKIAASVAILLAWRAIVWVVNPVQTLSLGSAAGTQLANSDSAYQNFIFAQGAWGMTSLLPLIVTFILIALWWSEIKKAFTKIMEIE